MIRCTRLILAASLAMSLTASVLLAQEDGPPAGRGGTQGGRGGGRGGRGGAGGARGTREFLGLGPAPDEAAAKKGEPLYKQNCGTCHGDNARGAQGPNLVRSVVVLHDEKGEEIGPVIKNGRPQARHARLPQPLGRTTSTTSRSICTCRSNSPPIAAPTAPPMRGVRSQTSGDAKKGEAVLQWRGRLQELPFRHRRPGEDRRQVPAGRRHAVALPLARHSRPRKGDGHHGLRPDVTGTVRTLNDFDVSITDAAGDYHYWPRDK